jgi:hypothetical protein
MKSSNSFSKLLLSTALLFALGTSAFGNTIVLTQNTSQYSGANGGGEFKAVSASLSNAYYAPSVLESANSLQVFCLETHENFTPNNSYYYSVNTGAISGDVVSSFDPLSKGSAWLMTKFATGTLAGYSYTNGAGRIAQATLLQEAFWALENEPADGSYTPGYNAGNAYDVMVAGVFGGGAAGFAAAQADATLTDLGHVRVLNLTTNADGTGWAQSQIAYIPDNSATLALLGLGLISIAFFRRRSA